MAFRSEDGVDREVLNWLVVTSRGCGSIGVGGVGVRNWVARRRRHGIAGGEGRGESERNGGGSTDRIVQTAEGIKEAFRRTDAPSPGNKR